MKHDSKKYLPLDVFRPGARIEFKIDEWPHPRHVIAQIKHLVQNGARSFVAVFSSIQVIRVVDGVTTIDDPVEAPTREVRVENPLFLYTGWNVQHATRVIYGSRQPLKIGDHYDGRSVYQPEQYRFGNRLIHSSMHHLLLQLTEQRRQRMGPQSIFSPTLMLTLLTHKGLIQRPTQQQFQTLYNKTGIDLRNSPFASSCLEVVDLKQVRAFVRQNFNRCLLSVERAERQEREEDERMYREEMEWDMQRDAREQEFLANETSAEEGSDYDDDYPSLARHEFEGRYPFVEDEEPPTEHQAPDGSFYENGHEV